MTEHVRIIGLGSPNGCDQFGWRVIDQLRQNHALQTLSDPPAELLSADRPGINLLHLLRDQDCVLLIDALTNCPAVGALHRLDRNQLLQHNGVLSSHAIGVAEALALGEKLGQLPQKLVLFGICVDPMEVEIKGEWISNMVDLVVGELGV